MHQPIAQLHLSVYKPHTTHNSSIRSDEALRLETSAFESLHGGQFTLDGGTGGGGGGLWHGSRTRKIEDHGSQMLKFRFHESRNFLITCSYTRKSA